ncbi:MAG: amidohydrolase family protein [Pseudomonadales bacterium]|nr:amidohydrolase family protein [Pseudomonadales bacterium]
MNTRSIFNSACSLVLLVFPLQNIAQDILVQGGTVVTSEASYAADVLVEDGVIIAIGQDLDAAQGVRLIDASGLLVLPGGVDPHVHLGGNWVDDYHTGSMAALAGGITTISNFPFATPGSVLTDLIEREANLIQQQAIADVILHTTITDPATQTEQLEALAATGQPSIKIFMNFDFFDPNAADFLQAVEVAGDAGILTLIHAEDASILSHQAGELEAVGQTSVQYLADARPPLAEETAMKRAVAMAEQSGSPMYAVHVSSERGLKVAQAARDNGLPFFIETRPIYLHLTSERFDSPEAGVYVGQPPLREQSDQDALWEGLANGTIQVVGTDHVAYSREDKLDPSQTITNHRAGMNHLQMLRPLLYSDGVLKGRITVEQMVAVTATNPAKLFGLFPRKGTIAVGSDADLVIWDPDETRTVRDEDMFSATGFSIYSGWEVTGWPLTTIRRGELVFENGEILGAAGSGQLLERDLWFTP